MTSEQHGAYERPIDHVEAREIARRLIAGAFRRDGEHLEDDRRPRLSIPARPDRDDDLLIVEYIKQQVRTDADLLELREKLFEAQLMLGCVERRRPGMVARCYRKFTKRLARGIGADGTRKAPA